MSYFRQNLRYAFRQLRRSPGFTMVAVISLAIGIGMNASMFSAFELILLRPLPVPEPERLVNLWASGPNLGSISTNAAGYSETVFSYPMFRDLEVAQGQFTGIAAHRFVSANLGTRDQAVAGGAMLVSGSYFPVLEVQPALGRLLGRDDDQTRDAHPVGVLSHRFWEARFAADPAVLGETIVVNGNPLTIVGVAPEGFEGTTLGFRPDVFVPLTMHRAVNSGFDHFDNRRQDWIYLFARLAPGVSVEQAQEALNVIYRPIINEVEAPLLDGTSEQEMARFRAKEIYLESGRQGRSSVHGGEGRAALILFLATTGVVLLIACANVANLLLARGVGRRQEMAIRGSLGAGRSRLLAQLLTESLVLAVLGGAAGLLVSGWALSLWSATLPPVMADWLDLRLNPAVFAYIAMISFGAAIVFGLYPALHATRPDLVSALKASIGQASGGRAAVRFRTSLVTAQVALSLALLVCGGLFVRSLMNVNRADLGFKADNLATFRVSPVLNDYDLEASRALFERLEAELAAIPGVTDVSAAEVAILTGREWGSDASVEGFDSRPGDDVAVFRNAIGAGYFRTLGMPILAGREFTEADARTAPKVAIVNEAFARKFGLARQDVVGKRMAMQRESAELDIEIVGLVRDAAYRDAKRDVPPLFFTPWRQTMSRAELTFYARTSTESESVLAMIPTVMRRLDPNLPVDRVGTMMQRVRTSVYADRMMTAWAATYGALATLLAAIGLYGVIAYNVAQRTREIGLRMALGAGTGRVRRMVLQHVGRLTLVGGAIGVLAALGLGRAAQSLLFEVERHDPWVFVGGAIVLALVALAAGYFPARRAARVDPMTALRAE